MGPGRKAPDVMTEQCAGALQLCRSDVCPEYDRRARLAGACSRLCLGSSERTHGIARRSKSSRSGRSASLLPAV